MSVTTVTFQVWFVTEETECRMGNSHNIKITTAVFLPAAAAPAVVTEAQQHTLFNSNSANQQRATVCWLTA